MTEATKILEKVSGKLNLLVCSGYEEPLVSSPSDKSPASDTHVLSNGSVMSDKAAAAVVSRNKSMKKGHQHFDKHNNSQRHLLNGN